MYKDKANLEVGPAGFKLLLMDSQSTGNKDLHRRGEKNWSRGRKIGNDILFAILYYTAPSGSCTVAS